MVSNAEPVPKSRGERARKDGDKLARHGAILDAAFALWGEKPYTDITVSDVARAAGLARGTLYLYFQTKEALFLAVPERLLWNWFGVVDRRLAAQERARPKRWRSRSAPL
ncbi:helix-turn-helix domain-containing protein [Deinococcus hopiensis]|uniref:helix-turn-helix domain-containing protein n=1 Tax=Deinococcus hopiensis TaxID=309885 RepID=UPI000A01E51D|nr:helix-turn-helix domain-containing protein [Deinococcus hopiensis]